MADTKKRNPLVGFAVVIVIGYFLYSCSSQKSTSPEDVAAEAAQTAEQKRKGFHCLSAWDGSHAKFKSAIKMQMRESDSFEHIETLVTPVSADGTHQLSMRYRARNGFGGMNVGTALGTYRNIDCEFTVISIE